MKTITVLTACRAEYGLLKRLIRKLKSCEDLIVRVVATGAHLSPEFGLTYKEIEQDGIKIDKKIEILLSADSPAAISKSMALAMISFADYFADAQSDALLVLGDRYETLAVCCAAMNAKIPIIHLHGGETTEGAVDEAIRHAVTKMSYLHFTSTEAYRQRVIQLGESPDRVFNVGALGVENALTADLLSQEALAESLSFGLDGLYAVITFHPVTLENYSAREQYGNLLAALDCFPDFKYIITKANADTDGRIINQMTDEYVQSHSNAVGAASLGVTRYLTAVKYAAMVIGNSSSGLIEVPSLKIPTVNIGDRQKGRLSADSVINCQPLTEDICFAMKKAMSEEFKIVAEHTVNPYGKGNTSDMIAETIVRCFSEGKINLKKKFFDIPVEV